MSDHTCFQCEHGGNTPAEWYGSPELAARADERRKVYADIELSDPESDDDCGHGDLQRLSLVAVPVPTATEEDKQP